MTKFRLLWFSFIFTTVKNKIWLVPIRLWQFGFSLSTQRAGAAISSMSSSGWRLVSSIVAFPLKLVPTVRPISSKPFERRCIQIKTWSTLERNNCKGYLLMVWLKKNSRQLWNKTIERVMELEMIRWTKQGRRGSKCTLCSLICGLQTEKTWVMTVGRRLWRGGWESGVWREGEREGEEGNGTQEKQILHGFSYMWNPGLKRVAWKMDGARSAYCPSMSTWVRIPSAYIKNIGMVMYHLQSQLWRGGDRRTTGVGWPPA